MAKFSALTLPAILASTSFVTAQIRTLHKSNRYQQVSRKRATSYRRRLEENELSIDGSYSIKFSSCLDIKTYNSDLFDDDIIAYVKSGKVVSAKSYVLFHTCQEEECSDDDLYIVDLSTYLTSVVGYRADEKENYCAACEEAEGMCFGDDEMDDGGTYDDDVQDGKDVNNYDDQNDGDAADYDNYFVDDYFARGRKLTEVNCEQCEALGCYEKDNVDDAQKEDRTDERVAEWVTTLAECERFENAEWNGRELYYGAICNADGNGVEFVTFLDEDCTVYARHQSFSSYYNSTYEEEEDITIDYASNAESYISSVLNDTMSCSKYEAPKGDDYVDEVEVNEYCQKLFKESAASMNECNVTTEDVDDDGYAWYSFDMTNENANDIDQVCTKVRENDGSYYHAYKAPSYFPSDSEYNIEMSTFNEWDSLSSFEMSTLEICIFIAVLVVFIFCWCKRMCTRRKSDAEMSFVNDEDERWYGRHA